MGVTSGPGSCSFRSSRSKLHFYKKKGLLRAIKDDLKVIVFTQYFSYL